MLYRYEWILLPACMSRPYVIAFVSFLLLSAHSHAKQLALSFDDGLNPNTNTEAAYINQQLLNHLDAAQIKSMIFPSYIKIGDYAGKELVRAWGQKGHIIANHSAFHDNLNQAQVTAEDYIHSIKINESIFKTLANYQYFFRYPYLKEGNTVEKRDQVKMWLKQHGYQHGAVSIDASDWFYHRTYLTYLKTADTQKIERLKHAYLHHLLDRAEYYDVLAQHTLGRSPKHVLLLHTNALNGAFLGDVIQHFKNHGWKIIDTTKAYTDPVYRRSSENIPAGESIIWSIAKSQGVEDLRYPAEDSPYELDNLRQYQLID